MSNPRFSLTKNWLYFSFCFLWFICIGYCVFFINKEESFLFINYHRSFSLDVLGTVATCIGDGSFTIILAFILFLLKKRRLSYLLFISYSVSGIIAQIMKHTHPMLRPAAWFNHTTKIYTASWSHLHSLGSFPSGHATSVFAAATIIALYCKKPIWGILCFLIACITAWSRIYLGQHFVEDIWYGSVLGTVSAVTCYSVYNYLLFVKQNHLFHHSKRV
ncbi:phosphatase PAP2 family protein [Arachidicoccus sp.]|uniref:phosphatase PAP2 family protein n=1 Tax=Arachidicoccus sp. TaxID=1872624 RepID=UPI003D1B2BB2